MNELSIRKIKIHKVIPVLSEIELKDIQFIEHIIKNLKQNYFNNNYVNFSYLNISIMYYNFNTYEIDLQWINIFTLIKDNTSLKNVKTIRKIFPYYIKKILENTPIHL